MKRKNMRVYTKMHKMPRLNVKNNNSVTLKHLRRNKLYVMRVELLPTEADKLDYIKKHFAMKLKKEFIKDVCVNKLLVQIDKRLVKIDKLPLKRDKNIKSIESMKTMDLLQDKSNMRSTTLLVKSNMSLSILNDMGVIILDPNTMKSNDMAS